MLDPALITEWMLLPPRFAFAWWMAGLHIAVDMASLPPSSAGHMDRMIAAARGEITDPADGLRRERQGRS